MIALILAAALQLDISAPCLGDPCDSCFVYCVPVPLPPPYVAVGAAPPVRMERGVEILGRGVYELAEPPCGTPEAASWGYCLHWHIEPCPPRSTWFKSREEWKPGESVLNTGVLIPLGCE